jgi:hypothetical protein
MVYPNFSPSSLTGLKWDQPCLPKRRWSSLRTLSPLATECRISEKMPKLPTPELLSEIDVRQVEVLRKLDELNGRIERAILTFSGTSPSLHAPSLHAPSLHTLEDVAD